MEHCTVAIPEGPANSEDGNITQQDALHAVLDLTATVGTTASSSKLENKGQGRPIEFDTAHRWYFAKNNKEPQTKPMKFIHESQCTFSCFKSPISTNKRPPPVKVAARNRFTSWYFEMKDCAPGVYEVILGISTKHLQVDKIDSIIFSVSNSLKEFTPSEIFSKEDLEQLTSASGNGVLKCKLHQQLLWNAPIHQKVIVMEIRSASSTSLGFLGLHYMELRPFRPDGYIDDPSLHIHQPCLWSLNVCQNDNSADDTQEGLKMIVHYAVSGDEAYAATLAVNGKHLLLDVWDLSHLTVPPSSPHDKHSHSRLNRPPCAREKVPILAMPDTIQGCPPYTVSVSWDGSQIALGDASAITPDPKESFNNIFTVYSLLGERTSLVPSTAYQHCSELRNFRGYGKFHVTTTTGQEFKNQLFITCNKGIVNVYSAYNKWTLLRSFAVDEPRDNPRINVLASWRLINSLRGAYCVWVSCDEYEIMVWNIENCSMVSFSLWQQAYSLKSVLDKVVVSLSTDCSMLAIYRGRYISIHWTATGTMLGSYLVPEAYAAISDVQFIEGNSRIIVNSRALDEDFGQGTAGFILDTVKMFPADYFSIPGEYRPQSSTGSGKHQRLYCASACTLGLISLQRLILYPFSRPPPDPTTLCDDNCECNLVPVRKLPTKFIAASGLHFSVELSSPPTRKLDQDIVPPSVKLLVSGGPEESEGPCRKFIIPPFQDPFDEWEDRRGLHTDPWKYNVIAFLETRSQLVIASRFLLMVWSLPSTLDGTVALHLAWCIKRDDDDLSDIFGGLWTICPHEQLFGRRMIRPAPGATLVKTVVMRPRVDHPSQCEYGSSAQKAIVILIDNLKTADETCRAAVSHYIASVGGCNPCDPAESMLAMICRAWKREAHDSYKSVAASLLDSSEERLALSHHSANASPFRILLDKAQDEPRAIDVTVAYVQHCFHKAAADRDPHHIQQILDCLPQLLNRKYSFTSLATWTLQKLAYIPVKSRRIVLEYHAVAHPAELRWAFWKPNSRPLEACKEPVFHLTSTKNRNPTKDTFFRPLFVAWFDMLWYPDDSDSSKSPSVPQLSSHPQTLHSWLHALVVIAWRRCTFQSKRVVKLHDFEPEMLENPAIVALIEYKWNTIGLQYWLVRFLCQCVFYLMVLTVVFAQVYNNQQQSLAGLYIAIAACSCVFLWLEIAQFVKDPGHYFTSVYNYVDLAVFGLPLAGSINQLILPSGGDLENQTPEKGNAGFYSFSVLFVFLHFLFELRMNSSVCQFVTIIIRIINKIRLFFFIFAGGIIAFAIATLHILRSCPFESCATTSTAFPSNFYLATTSTYFFMGGRYDPISADLDSGNVAFHALMAVYFFFTVILMLNVLIALINTAYDLGDSDWRVIWLENRLRCIERAENMSHEIPGFRQTYKWFPNEIYYSATAKQVEAYCNSRESDLPNGDTAQGPMSSTYEATASAHSGTWQTSSSKQQRGWDELQEVLRKQQETFQKQDQKQNQTIEGLKNDMELRHAELLNQLLIQREIYEHQNTELRKQLATLLEMTEDLARG